MRSSKAISAGASDLLSKVPAVTVAFWVIKICATTVGETGGDAVSMTLKVGYLVSTFIFLGIFGIALAAQVLSKRYHPFFYWFVVVATTTVGTTMSDYLDRTAGLGYIKSSIILFGGVLLALYLWHRFTGAIEFENITTRKNEVFYWVTILVSNTLGTALGDFMATTTGLGFQRGAMVFAFLIAVVAAAHLFTNTPENVLFWSAYVLTRPLGDTLTKPVPEGGFGLSRITSSLVIAAVMAVGIILMSRKKKLAPESG